MIDRRKLFHRVSGVELKELLDKYDFEKINIMPLTEKELYNYYERYTDSLVVYCKKMTDDSVFVLGNEVRAMLGHLAEYRLNPIEKKNLQDAYGHFRRLNIDTLKIICNELDKFFLTYLKEYYHYDFRGVYQDFLFEYLDKFFLAQKSYLRAQLSEHTGSDRIVGNIIGEYHVAAKCYADLFVFLESKYKKLKRIKCLYCFKSIWTFTLLILGIFVSIFPFIYELIFVNLI